MTQAEIDLVTTEAGIVEAERLIGLLDEWGVHRHDDGVICDEVGGKCRVLLASIQGDDEAHQIVTETIFDALEVVGPLCNRIRRLREQEKINHGIMMSSVRAASELGVRIVDWCRSQGIAIPDEVLYPRPGEPVPSNVKYAEEIKAEIKKSNGAKKPVTVAVGDTIVQCAMEPREYLPIMRMLTDLIEKQTNAEQPAGG